MNPLKLAIHGAAGRMGRRLVALAAADSQWQLVAAMESDEHPQSGSDAGVVAGIGPIGVHLSSALPESADVLVDFSVPAAAARLASVCAGRRLPLVVATTGLSAAEQQAVRSAAEATAILWSPNMSLAVNLAMKLAEVAAEALRDHPSGADVEIVERHHRYKEDAPSGTALEFGRLIAQRMGQTAVRHGRQGRPGLRPHDEIGYHALRAGDHPGEHTVLFGLLGESLEIKVSATSRDAYALGALAAARFVCEKPPGLYTMRDVLGL